MSMSDTISPHWPDPVTQPEFYAGTTTKRAFAWVFDVIFISLLVVPTVVMTAFIGLFFLPVVYLTVGFVYRWATLAGGSATWGMRLMALEFRNARGERLDAGEAFLHTGGYTLSVTTGLVQLGSVILMLMTERGQGLTDLALGTVLLNRRAG